MVNVEKLVSTLKESGVKFFTGIPDSLLKSFCSYLTDCGNNQIAANEGGAVGLAAGHYLATGKPACVYMQNSGQGNAVNPLASLTDPDVYSIPMLLVIGWRGMPGVHDEPQHVKQGKITLELLKTLGIPTEVLPETTTKACTCVKKLLKRAVKESRPVAVVVRKGLFEEYKLKNKEADIARVKREVVIEKIIRELPRNAVIVSTTGMISREVYETRERLELSAPVAEDGDGTVKGCAHARDFLTVGSMGHASQIALGIAKAQPKRPVVCLDGDGASIMQMGNMAIVGQSGCKNLTHIVLNNAAHDSVGGQPTVGGRINLKAIARACGYRLGNKALRKAPLFVEIKVAKGARADLGRPKVPPQMNKKLFMKTLGVRA